MIEEKCVIKNPHFNYANDVNQKCKGIIYLPNKRSIR